jgi:hypothetical protein
MVATLSPATTTQITVKSSHNRFQSAIDARRQKRGASERALCSSAAARFASSSACWRALARNPSSSVSEAAT